MREQDQDPQLTGEPENHRCYICGDTFAERTGWITLKDGRTACLGHLISFMNAFEHRKRIPPQAKQLADDIYQLAIGTKSFDA